jgi:hypothetical protein
LALLGAVAGKSSGRDHRQVEIVGKGLSLKYSRLVILVLSFIISLQQRRNSPPMLSTARIINEADIIPDRSAGYRLDKGDLKNQEWVSPSLNTTADGQPLFLNSGPR